MLMYSGQAALGPTQRRSRPSHARRAQEWRDVERPSGHVRQLDEPDLEGSRPDQSGEFGDFLVARVVTYMYRLDARDVFVTETPTWLMPLFLTGWGQVLPIARGIRAWEQCAFFSHMELLVEGVVVLCIGPWAD